MKICHYGCGQEAKYPPSKGKTKWSCKSFWQQCPAKRKEHSVRMEKEWEDPHSRLNSDSCREKKSEANKGQIPWNKGKTDVYSEETLKRMSESNKLTIEQIKEKYKTFSSEEEMRYNPDKPEEKEIQVHCKNNNCPNSKEKGGWFIPTGSQFDGRRRELERPKGNDGGFFYCSQYCKDTCPCYRVINDPLQLAEYQRYQKEVWKYTNLSLKYNFNKIPNIGFRGREYGYDLDHKFSIIDGFNNDIDPKTTGNWRNLKVIKTSDNRKKSRNSSIPLEEIQKIEELYTNKNQPDYKLGSQN